MTRAGMLAAAIVLLSVAPAHAYRPFDGTDADVSGTGEIELELEPLGYLRSQNQSALVFANTIFNYGFIPRWELVVEGVGLVELDAPPPPRFINGGVFLKHVLREGSLQGGHGLSLAMEAGVLIPTTDEPLASDGGVSLAFIASQAWREFIMHVNVSIARSTDKQPDLFVGSIFEFHPHARIRPVTEIFVERHGAQTIPSLLVGTIFQAWDTLSLDAATRFSWTNDAPLFELRVGLTWTIPLRRRDHRTGGGGG